MTDAARLFHEETKNRPDGRPGERAIQLKSDRANTPITFKDYVDVPIVPLPTELLRPASVAATDALAATMGQADRFDLPDLAALLALSAGITRTIDPSRTERPWTYFPAASSAHSYPDVYVVSADLDGLGAGVYYFHPLELHLRQLRRGDYRSNVAEAAVQPEIARRPVTLVLSGVPWRAAWLYGERALRHVFWDVGGLLANMVTLSDALGLGAKITTGFRDGQLTALIGVDGLQQFPVAVATFGPVGRPAEPAASVEPLPFADPPISLQDPIEFPLIVEAQKARTLASAEAVVEWRRAGRVLTSAASPDPVVRWRGPSASILDVILRRGSTRRFRTDPIARASVDWILATATRPWRVDHAPRSATSLEHSVLVHAVDGVAPGVYRYTPTGLEPVRSGDVRNRARFVSLEQAKGGDCAITTFQSADLDRVCGALGPRGYGIAQMEAGYVLERLHLAAFTLGIGATGLTFYDDEAAALCETTNQIMSEVAIGVPAYRAKRGRLGRAATEIAGDPAATVR